MKGFEYVSCFFLNELKKTFTFVLNTFCTEEGGMGQYESVIDYVRKQLAGPNAQTVRNNKTTTQLGTHSRHAHTHAHTSSTTY